MLRSKTRGLTLLGGELADIARARRVSHATMGNIHQNPFLAFIYNLVGVPIAAGLLHPVFGLLLSPTIAAGAAMLSSLSVAVRL
jgi:cation transport ATPase